MKRKIAAVTLSITLGMMSLVPVHATDFLDDTQASVVQTPEFAGEQTDFFGENVNSDVTDEGNQTDQTDHNMAGTVEDPIEENPVQEEVNDFVDEIDFSAIAGAEQEENDGNTIEATEENLEEEFVTEMFHEAQEAGWEVRTVDGVRKFMYAKGSENEEGQAEYCTSEDGIVTINEKQYYFDENGYMLTGRVEYKSKYIFLMSAERATLNSGASGQPTPVNSNLGQQQKAYWNWDGKAFSYYASSGYFASISALKEAKMQNGTYVGYYKIDGSYFVLRDNGVPYTGDYKMTEGNRQGIYYLYPTKNEKGYPGAMAIKTWVNIKNSTGSRWRYYDGSGRTKLGIKAVKLDKNINPSVGDYTFLLTESGYVYEKAVIRKATDGYYYACNTKGVIQKDKLFTYNGSRYYMDAKGRRVSWTNSWHRLKKYGNRPYYFGSTPGRIKEQKGWVKITSGTKDKWYYFTKKGNALVNGWCGDYYFDTDCSLVTGPKTINGKNYFFRFSDAQNHNGKVYKNKLIEYKKKVYYAGADGVLYRNKWVTLGGNDYFFKSDGTKATNCFEKKGKTYGYLDADGKFTVGWVVENASANKIRYINTKAPGYVKNDYRVIDGVRYYFNAEGYRVSDLTSYYPSNWRSDPVLTKLHNGGYAPYYLECDKTNGVITVYTDSSKTIPVRSIRTSVGNPTGLTPSGNYPLTRSSRWQPLMGPSWGQYGTHVVQGIFIHSVACGSANSYNLPGYAYDMLGSPASHGCMRVCVADAKWIYDNCNGGRINIFYGGYQSQECFKGPLGRKPLVPRYGSGNFDPTDPAV